MNNNTRYLHYPRMILSAACLLLLSATMGCTGELPPTGETTKWVPIEINVAGIEQIDVKPIGTKATTFPRPSIVKTSFATGDELKVTFTQAGASTSTTITVVKQSDGSWKKADGTPFTLPATPDNSAPTMYIEYGTEIPDDPGFSVEDFLFAQVIPTYNSDSKTYTCSFNLQRPEEYSCLYVKFTIIDPDDDYFSTLEHYYISAIFIGENYRERTPKFPVTNDILQVFYKGTFTAYGSELEWNQEFEFEKTTYFERFDGEYSYGSTPTTFTLTPGKITAVHLIVPWYNLGI